MYLQNKSIAELGAKAAAGALEIAGVRVDVILLSKEAFSVGFSLSVGRKLWQVLGPTI